MREAVLASRNAKKRAEIDDAGVALDNETLLEMYWYLILSRRVDERGWAIHRQGKIAFHISGLGHEAIQVAMAFAVKRGHDMVFPYYRDLGLMLAMGLTCTEFMLGLYGREGEPSSGARSRWSLSGCCRSAFPTAWSRIPERHLAASATAWPDIPAAGSTWSESPERTEKRPPVT